jgi:hypothetical protein
MRERELFPELGRESTRPTTHRVVDRRIEVQRCPVVAIGTEAGLGGGALHDPLGRIPRPDGNAIARSQEPTEIEAVECVVQPLEERRAGRRKVWLPLPIAREKILHLERRDQRP